MRTWVRPNCRAIAAASALLGAIAIVLCQFSPSAAAPPPGGTEASRSIQIDGTSVSRVTCPVGTGPLQVGSADLSAACDANPLNLTPDGASTFTLTTVIGSGSANFRDVAAG